MSWIFHQTSRVLYKMNREKVQQVSIVRGRATLLCQAVGPLRSLHHGLPVIGGLGWLDKSIDGCHPPPMAMPMSYNPLDAHVQDWLQLGTSTGRCWPQTVCFEMRMMGVVKG